VGGAVGGPVGSEQLAEVDGLDHLAAVVGELVGPHLGARRDEVVVDADPVQDGGAEGVKRQAVAVLAVLRRLLGDHRLTALAGELGGERQTCDAPADDQYTHPHSSLLFQRS
jgi:hypothetical protein